MKNALIVLSLGLLLGACNNQKKPGEITVKSEDGKTSTTVNTDAMSAKVDELQKKSEELKKLSPYTLDQMKAMLPEELAGVKRNSFSTNSSMGTAFARADYKLNDTADIELNLFDCAGEAGAGIYNMHFLVSMNMESESDDEYMKTIDLNGERAIEQGEKDNHRHTLTWLAGDRVLVTLQGNNTGIDPLKQAAGQLHIK